MVDATASTDAASWDAMRSKVANANLETGIAPNYQVVVKYRDFKNLVSGFLLQSYYGVWNEATALSLAFEIAICQFCFSKV